MRTPSTDRIHDIARLLLMVAAISAVVVLAAAVVVPSIPMPAGLRTLADAARFVGPPLALLTGLLALLHARRRERRGDRRDPEHDTAAIVFRSMLLIAAGVMALGVLSALWSAVVLAAGDLLR